MCVKEEKKSFWNQVTEIVDGCDDGDKRRKEVHFGGADSSILQSSMQKLRQKKRY